METSVNKPTQIGRLTEALIIATVISSENYWSTQFFTFYNISSVLNSQSTHSYEKNRTFHKIMFIILNKKRISGESNQFSISLLINDHLQRALKSLLH